MVDCQAAEQKAENMTQTQRYKHPQLPQSRKETAADFLKARCGTAQRGDLTKLLDRAPDVPPVPQDAIKD
ncbi:hypothetical protein CDV52_17790 [Haematobacter missouriensis]|uniref:Uncharacterized protein n=2 Tax=Haematobacter TaxID=366614 RepID=A0A212AJB1_9RHOB|nr:hypothetical protein [Haematobacter genomosp. 1]OWJ76628.1 hypothetical protein CDV49_14155 [Haematobacter genomosp. 1]OWJ81523.1 hypothetical protein CDV52_17790 [Haematobacter missouriensis]